MAHKVTSVHISDEVMDNRGVVAVHEEEDRTADETLLIFVKWVAIFAALYFGTHIVVALLQ